MAYGVYDGRRTGSPSIQHVRAADPARPHPCSVRASTRCIRRCPEALGFTGPMRHRWTADDSGSWTATATLPPNHGQAGLERIPLLSG